MKALRVRSLFVATLLAMMILPARAASADPPTPVTGPLTKTSEVLNWEVFENGFRTFNVTVTFDSTGPFTGMWSCGLQAKENLNTGNFGGGGQCTFDGTVLGVAGTVNLLAPGSLIGNTNTGRASLSGSCTTGTGGLAELNCLLNLSWVGSTGKYQGRVHFGPAD